MAAINIITIIMIIIIIARAASLVAVTIVAAAAASSGAAAARCLGAGQERLLLRACCRQRGRRPGPGTAGAVCRGQRASAVVPLEARSGSWAPCRRGGGGA